MKSVVSPQETPIWASICTPVAAILLISSGHSPRLGGHNFLLGGTSSHLRGHGPGMTPVAPDLDVLQGEEKAYTGKLLPTIASVLNALKSERLMSIDYCHSLLENLIDSVQARFIVFASFCSAVKM